MHGMTVQLTVEGNTCSDVFARCDDIDCRSHCKSLHGASSFGFICDDFNLCTCFFNQDSPSPNICHAGVGTCFQGECDLSCCNARCASTFKEASGTCVPNPGTKDRCVCSYRS